MLIIAQQLPTHQPVGVILRVSHRGTGENIPAEAPVQAMRAQEQET